MSNPKNFCEEAIKLNIRYEYLIEARECIGAQNLARMFYGKSSRGGGGAISASTMDTWLETFRYVKEHPDEEDKDQYTARRLEPKQEYYDYVELIKIPIPDDIVKKWSGLSQKSLGDAAEKYGITLGIRNSKAIKTLLQRMLIMVERRKQNIWNAKIEEILQEDKPVINYRLTNVPELRRICKERNLVNAHIKTKEGLVQLLERNPNIIIEEVDEDIIDYNKMTTKELKNLAKEKGFTVYNNLSKTQLVKLFEDNDKEEVEIIVEDDEAEIIVEEEDEDEKNKDEESNKTENIVIAKDFEIKEYNLKLKDGNDFIIPIRKDGFINATLLCKAGNKEWKDYNKSKRCKTIVDALKNEVINSHSEIIITKIGGNIKLQGTWIHRLLAIDLASWIYTPFAVQILKWTDELLRKGEVKLQRPIKPLLLLTEIDIEAEELELNFNIYEFTNKCVLYMAYIGKGLVKIGYSDCRIIERESKHVSCESEYDQFRMLKIFEISSKVIEDVIKKLLQNYKENFGKQNEIFRPPGTLKNFIEIVDKILKDNDLKLQLDLAIKEIYELKLKNSELLAENLRLKLEK